MAKSSIGRTPSVQATLRIPGRMFGLNPRELIFVRQISPILCVCRGLARGLVLESEAVKPSKYERFKIETKPAPHVYQIPNKFDVSARKIRLAAMLVHEAFEFKLNKEVVLSRPCIYGVFGGRFGGVQPLKHKGGGGLRGVPEYPHIITGEQS